MGLTYQMKMKIPFDMADMNGHIKLPDVILLSLQVSGMQSIELGVSDKTILEEHNLVWIITDYDIEVVRLPRFAEEITIETEALSYNRLFCYRRFTIYDVVKGDCYHGGGAFPVCLNDKPLAPFKAKPLGDFLIAGNSGMLETNEWGLADLSRAVLGVRVYGSAAISFAKILSGRLLTYVTYLQPWDYAAASILGESLGYRVVTLSGQALDFQTRQPVMMLPLEMQEEIQSYIYERKRT